jgi:hypothetical protein
MNDLMDAARDGYIKAGQWLRLPSFVLRFRDEEDGPPHEWEVEFRSRLLRNDLCLVGGEIRNIEDDEHRESVALAIEGMRDQIYAEMVRFRDCVVKCSAAAKDAAVGHFVDDEDIIYWEQPVIKSILRERWLMLDSVGFIIDVSS